MVLYQRNIFETVVAQIPGREAIFVFGARQCGKTTLLKQIRQAVGEDHSLYLDLEYPELLEVFSKGINEVLKYLRYHRKHAAARTCVCIDEIQYVSDMSGTIKLLVDHHADEFKLVLTGSSSALIKYQFRESLVGRKQVFELYPLSFDEFLLFRGEDDLRAAISRDADIIPQSEHPRLEMLVEEYMVFGAYPKVSITADRDQKKNILFDISSSYILKDLKQLFRIEKIDQLNHLVRYLAVNIGKECNIQQIATEIGLHRETVENYLNILEESYVIRRLKPFHSNLTTELRKTPKVYFIDPGVRNVLLPDFNGLDKRRDSGELFENFVFLNLFQNAGTFAEIRYWKTRNGQEIDFIVKQENSLHAYECKLSGGKAGNFKVFAAAYPDAMCRKVVFKRGDRSRGDVYGWEKLI